MTSGASCGFTCPANQVVDKATTCSATAITLGSCKASYCSGVDTYAANSDAGASGKGNCGTTLALGGTCTPATKTGYTCTGQVTCASTSVANTLAVKSENFACTLDKCTISSGAAVTPTGATATGACTTLINAKSMTSGASCGFTCPANQVVDKATTCSATAITLGSCKASYCSGVDTYAANSDAGARGQVGELRMHTRQMHNFKRCCRDTYWRYCDWCLYYTHQCQINGLWCQLRLHLSGQSGRRQGNHVYGYCYHLGIVQSFLLFRRRHLRRKLRY